MKRNAIALSTLALLIGILALPTHANFRGKAAPAQAWGQNIKRPIRDPRSNDEERERSRKTKSPTNFLFNPSLQESRYIGFGDSITYGTINHVDMPEKGYIPRLKKLLDEQFGATDVFNEGLGGEETAQGLIRLDSVLAAHQTRYILIMEGTNDVTFRRSAQSIADNLEAMIKKCLAAGLLPAISTIIPRGEGAWPYPEAQAIQTDANAKILIKAAELHVPSIDLYKVFNEYPNGLGELLSADLKHPSERGYQVMAEQWFAAIRNYPFPPVGVQIRREYDEILFYRRLGNMINWEMSPKIQDASLIAGIKIYRRKRGEGVDRFQLVAQVTSSTSYFDTAIQSGTVYEYVLAAIRDDGIEGPCTEIFIL